MCLQVNAACITENLAGVAVLTPEGGIGGLAVAACGALLAADMGTPLHLLAVHCGNALLHSSP